MVLKDYCSTCPEVGLVSAKNELCSQLRLQTGLFPLQQERREGPPEAPDDVMMSEGSSVMPGGGRSPATWEARLEEPEGGRGVGAPRVKGPD